MLTYFEQSENEHDDLLVTSNIGLFEDVDQWIEEFANPQGKLIRRLHRRLKEFWK